MMKEGENLGLVLIEIRHVVDVVIWLCIEYKNVFYLQRNKFVFFSLDVFCSLITFVNMEIAWNKWYATMSCIFFMNERLF